MIQSSLSEAGQLQIKSSNTQQGPSHKDKTNKKMFEQVWKALFFIVMIGSMFFLKYIYQYQTLEEFSHMRRGKLTTLLGIGIPFGIFFILADQMLHKMLDPLCEKYYINHSKYHDPDARKKRCYTLVRWAFSFTYYAISSITGYLILLPTSFMPTWLGGNGNCTDCIRYLKSFDEATWAMQVYYAFQFGKQSGRLFQHVFIHTQGSFYQFALHHLMSTLLIFISYMLDFWMIGIFVLMIHDVSDGLLLLPRAYRDCKVIFKPLIKLMYFIAAFAWISCRIYMLSYCAVYTSISNLITVYKNPSILAGISYETLTVPTVFIAFMLLALLVQQLFWTYHIISSFIEVNVSSKLAKHTYD